MSRKRNPLYGRAGSQSSRKRSYFSIKPSLGPPAVDMESGPFPDVFIGAKRLRTHRPSPRCDWLARLLGPGQPVGLGLEVGRSDPHRLQNRSLVPGLRMWPRTLVLEGGERREESP